MDKLIQDMLTQMEVREQDIQDRMWLVEVCAIVCNSLALVSVALAWLMSGLLMIRAWLIPHDSLAHIVVGVGLGLIASGCFLFWGNKLARCISNAFEVYVKLSMERLERKRKELNHGL
jgi:hypothetical protein